MNAIKEQQTDLILLDFFKAFDKVSHEKLLLKLHHCGVCGQVLHWIKTFLSNRSQQKCQNAEFQEPGIVKCYVFCFKRRQRKRGNIIKQSNEK